MNSVVVQGYLSTLVPTQGYLTLRLLTLVLGDQQQPMYLADAIEEDFEVQPVIQAYFAEYED